MRPLTEDETKLVFEKLAKFIGKNIKELIDRSDEEHCFRLHRDRLYYVNEKQMRKATNISRDNLMSLGTCFGKFTKSKKFRLHISSLDYLAQYAQHKVWLKPAAELSFLYGNHIVKGGLHRITQNTPANQGVVIFSQSDVPLGFGVTARSAAECVSSEPTAIVVLHQADIGEYLRSESELT